MNLDIVSLRSTIGCFCSAKVLVSKKNKFVLLGFAFKYLLKCLLYIMNHLLKQLIRYLCLSAYFICLFIWCCYFCIAVRLFTLFFYFAKNHPLLLLCVHQWWILILILRDGDIHRHPGPQRNLLKFMH